MSLFLLCSYISITIVKYRQFNRAINDRVRVACTVELDLVARTLPRIMKITKGRGYKTENQRDRC